MRHYRFKLILCLASLFASACSYTVVDKPSLSTDLETTPSTLVVGYVRNAKTPFYDGVVSGLGDIPGGNVVVEIGGGDWPVSTLVLNGTLEVATRDSFGEKFGRHVVGFGASRRHVSGNFQLSTVGQEPKLAFSATEFYNGGTGLGGFFDIPGWFVGPIVAGFPLIGYQADVIGTDTMQKRLGKEVGATVRNWILAKSLKN